MSSKNTASLKTTTSNNPLTSNNSAVQSKQKSYLWLWVLLLILACIGIYFFFVREKKYKCDDDKCVEIKDDEIGEYYSSNCNNKCESNKPPNVPRKTYNCVEIENGSGLPNQVCMEAEEGTVGEFNTNKCNGSCIQLGDGLKYECVYDESKDEKYCVAANSNGCINPDSCYDNDSNCNGECIPEPSFKCMGKIIDDTECDIECKYMKYEITQKLQGNPSNGFGCDEIFGKYHIKFGNDEELTDITNLGQIDSDRLRTLNVGDIIYVKCENCEENPDGGGIYRYKCVSNDSKGTCTMRDTSENWYDRENNTTFKDLHDCLTSNCRESGLNTWFISNDIDIENCTNDKIANGASCFNSYKCLNKNENIDIYNSNRLISPEFNTEQECKDSIDSNIDGNLYTGLYVKRQVIQGMNTDNNVINGKGRIVPYINPICGHELFRLDELYLSIGENDTIPQEIKDMCFPIIENKLNEFIIENKKILDDNLELLNNCDETIDCSLIQQQIDYYNQSYPDNLQPLELNNIIGTEEYTQQLLTDILILPSKYVLNKDNIIEVSDDYDSLNENRSININNLKNGSQYQCIPTDNPDESQYRSIIKTSDYSPLTPSQIYNEKIIDVLYDCEQSFISENNNIGGSSLSVNQLNNSWGYFMGSSGIPGVSSDIYNNYDKNSSESSSIKNIPNSMIVNPDENDNCLIDDCNCGVNYAGNNKTCASSCLVNDLNNWMPENCGDYADLNNCGLEGRNIILGMNELNKPDICLDKESKAWFPSTEDENENYCFGTKYKNIDTNGSGEGGFKYGNYTPYDFTIEPGKCIYRNITRDDIIEQEKVENEGDTWIFESQEDCEENWKCQQVLPNQHVDYCANNSSRSPCRGDGDKSHCGPGKGSDYQETIDYPYKYINWDDPSSCSDDTCRVCTKRGFGGYNNETLKNPIVSGVAAPYDTRICFQFDKGGSTNQTDCVKFW
jgi:hypothetical protein